MLECLKCGNIVYKSTNRCNCGEILYPIVNTISQFYLNKKVTMGEGNTSMFINENLKSQIGCKSLYIKNETTNPTGSFKDRGSIKEVLTALRRGYKSIVAASTGNMGISLAAYSAYVGLKCFIFAPCHTSYNKLNRMEDYGAEIYLINGGYNDCLKIAEEFSTEKDVFLAGDYNLRMIGMLSLGYELKEYNPDVIICPVGNGNLLYSLYLSNKMLGKKIQLIGVQIEGYNTIGDNLIYEVDNINTICPAVEVEYPLQGLGVIKALKETNGYIVTVNNDDALKAQNMIAKNGLYLEPSGALSFAGGMKLNLENKKVVCIGTGRN